MFQVDHSFQALDALRTDSNAIKAAEWKGLPVSRDNAGLYSWWVDRAGAETLARRLREPIYQGLIYAGQAGATRWPSGAKSAQTLNGRICTNHLGGRIRGSTFRRTLAAALLEELNLQVVPGRKVSLAPKSEADLTKWMRTHLFVAVWPFEDRELLEHLEEHILRDLDPQFNLRGMPTTPIRMAIREARKNLSNLSSASSQFVESRSNAFSEIQTARSVTLHEEISNILMSEGNTWMSTRKIAERVNARGRYKKRDGSAVTDFQVHGRTRNYSDLFERDGQSVRLAKS